MLLIPDLYVPAHTKHRLYWKALHYQHHKMELPIETTVSILRHSSPRLAEKIFNLSQYDKLSKRKDEIWTLEINNETQFVTWNQYKQSSQKNPLLLMFRSSRFFPSTILSYLAPTSSLVWVLTTNGTVYSTVWKKEPVSGTQTSPQNRLSPKTKPRTGPKERAELKPKAHPRPLWIRSSLNEKVLSIHSLDEGETQILAVGETGRYYLLQPLDAYARPLDDFSVIRPAGSTTTTSPTTDTTLTTVPVDRAESSHTIPNLSSDDQITIKRPTDDDVHQPGYNAEDESDILSEYENNTYFGEESGA